MARKKSEPPARPVAENRKARHTYFIDETVEAGLMLEGTEVKSLRAGQGNIADAYAEAKDGELFLINADIPQYTQASHFNHHSRRPRKLLMHKREIEKLAGLIQRSGVTVVPLKIYFNKRGIAKTELGLARGKKQHDKRQTEKDRDWGRQKARIMRDRG